MEVIHLDNVRAVISDSKENLPGFEALHLALMRQGCQASTIRLRNDADIDKLDSESLI